MFKTKKEVDRHVRTALAKLRSDSEKNLRGYTVAKLYFKINEYESAEHYISGYLSVKEDCGPAHKLLGQCYLQLKKPDKALQAFQRSLQLDRKQPDLLVEVCKLLLSDSGGEVNPNKAKYWCDLAEAEKVQHDAVFNLKLKLLHKDNLETNQIEDIILKEIIARPLDPNLRVRFVKHLLEQNKLAEAFKYAFDLEMKHHDVLNNSIEWYNSIWMVLTKYKQIPNYKKCWDYWLLLVICLERQVDLSISSRNSLYSDKSTINESVNLLFSFDQHLYEASQCVFSACKERELATQFLYHFRGQLCLHMAALLFKREQTENKNQWRETTKNVLPLLLFAYYYGTPDTQEAWLKRSGEQSKQLIQLWNLEGSFRCAQAGRTLLSCIDDDKEASISAQVHQVMGKLNGWTSTDDLLAQVRQFCSDGGWRNRLYRIIFTNCDLLKIQTSHLVNCPQLNEPTYDFPSVADVEAYEEIAQYVKPQSLPHMVYLCLGIENLADTRCKYFNGLNLTTQNLSACSAESLNQLDIETYLYASALQAKRTNELEKCHYDNYNNTKNAGKPTILLFANMVSKLCSEEQCQWWYSAYKVYKNLTSENHAELRATLQHGIEAVRGINGPKIDLIIVLKLGKIFVDRANDASRPIERNALEARAENLYRYGLHMLKLHNKGVLEPFRKVFKYSGTNNSSIIEREITSLGEEAITFLANRYFKKAEFEECIDEFSGIQLPFAAYFQAEAYRKLDESNKTPKKNKRMYIEKAKECLNQTLNLLTHPNVDSNHPLHSVVNSDLKRLQYTNKFLVENYNNGYQHDVEDTLNDSFGFMNINRSRRETTPSPKTVELENLVKQIHTTLSLLREEVVTVIKDDIAGIKNDVNDLKDKLGQIEEGMKKKSETPSAEDQNNVLDDLYIIDDELQNQNFANQSSIYSNFATQHQQQQRMHTPNTLLGQQPLHQLGHHQQAPAPNPYNSPLYNTTYPLSYYPQYMLPGTAGAANLPQRALGLNQHVPFVDPTMSFNLPQQALTLPHTDNRSSIVGLLTQSSSSTQPPAILPALDKTSLNQPLLEKPLNPALGINGMSTGIPSNFLNWNRPYNNAPVEKEPPVNVVITSSDPLPAHTTISTQPTLSVTIPPQHIKPSAVPTEAINLSNPSQDPANISTSSVEEPEYDPIPDFKPIIPMPPEVEVRTGEENEEVLFTAHAKLFRIVEKEWKERGLGDIKILKNKTDGKARILMRRDKTHKICANHVITAEIQISPKDEKSYIWAAHDFADEEPKLEKLCVRFKLKETGQEFFKVFTNVQKDVQQKCKSNEKTTTESTAPVALVPISKSFAFNFGKVNITTTTSVTSSTTSMIPATIPATVAPADSSVANKTIFSHPSQVTSTQQQEKQEKSSPFADFTFGKLGSTANTPTPSSQPFANIFSSLNKSQTDSNLTPGSTLNTSGNATLPLASSTTPQKEENLNKSTGDGDEDDYVPTAQFAPVIPLPDLVEVQTGEENEKIVFEHRAKLLRYDKTTKEWKERGIGNMKILVNLSDPNKVRLLMRREKILKLCCNQLLTKDLKFMPKGETALTWAGQDFSENELQTETLCIRFKISDTCKAFHEAVLAAQNSMTAMGGEEKSKKKDQQKGKSTQKGFGDKFKPKPGSWSCKSCYVTNKAEDAECTACGDPKDGSKPRSALSFGDQFKPEPGSWDCKSCYVINKPGNAECTACGDPKDGSKPRSALSFGYQFEPGSWQCKSCDVTNKPGNAECTACGDPKDGSKPRSALSFGYQFEPGSWQCKSCDLINKPGNAECTACGDPKDGSKPRSALSFGYQFEPGSWQCKSCDLITKPGNAECTACGESKDGSKPRSALSFGDQFKPEPGSWECKSCDLINKPGNAECTACGDPKDGSKPRSALSFGYQFEPGSWQCKSCDLITKPGNAECTACGESKDGSKPRSALSFGDQFKPEPGSWECKSCYVTNKAEDAKCVACGDLKDKSVTSAGDKAKPAGGKPISAISFGSKPADSTTTSASVQGFGDKFKPKPGSWCCQGCYTSNTADVLYCACCEEPKDDTVPKKAPASVLGPANGPSKFTFGFSAAHQDPKATDITKAEPATESITASTSATTIPVGFAFGKPPVTNGFNFGNLTNPDQSTNLFKPPASITTEQTGGNGAGSLFSTAATANSGFGFSLNSTAATAPIFGVPTGTDGKTNAASKPFSFSFAKPAATTEPDAASSFKLDKQEFNFQLKPKSPGKNKSPLKNTSGIDEESDNEDVEEENNTYFTPVIALPDKVDVKTGEEDEEVLYCHRAKLYRYTDSEWKERGLGNVKILRHIANKKLRVVMRREQVLKICLNHALTEDVEYKRKDDKSWHYVVNDFSEGELKLSQFCLRFKTKEIADEFSAAVNNALDGKLEPIAAPDETEAASPVKPHESQKSDDVTSTSKLSPLVSKLAKKLQLPEEFFIEPKEKCSGCRGCDPDSFVFRDIPDINNLLAECENALPLEMPKLRIIPRPVANANIENHSLVKESSFSFPITPSKSVTITTPSSSTPSINAQTDKPSVFPLSTASDKKSEKDKFVFSLDSTKPASAENNNSKDNTFGGSGGFLFGSLNTSFASAEKAKPAFGQTTIFGGGATITPIVKPSTSTTTAAPNDTGKTLFGSALNPAEGGNLFGGTTGFSFGTSNFGSSIFGGTNALPAFSFATQPAPPTTNNGSDKDQQSSLFKKTGSTFGTLAAPTAAPVLDANSNTETSADSKSEPPKEPIFKTDPNFSFASLAQANNSTSNFRTSQNTSGFIGLTGNDAFSNFLGATKDGKEQDVQNHSGAEASGGDDGNYDPHYDPIIELPKEIVVSTGEENEEKLFGERTTLFRWDSATSEWKERGVGELKILYHPVQGTYRLVMRREQIHKLVLNHAIPADFQMRPMNNSPKAFCWATVNYAEEQGQTEKLAVRFKNPDLASKFQAEINKCIEQVQKRSDLEPEDD